MGQPGALDEPAQHEHRLPEDAQGAETPYLDTDHHTYYPNQLIVNCSSSKYDEVGLVMMEDDGSTNYAALTRALADAILSITDQGVYVPLVDVIIAAV
ncbi:DUF3103 family protein [Streptomyces sp. SRF1]|uniref:DUF3103 family protein n=1 Tax=Streptomyces sp. SRF1 TaxID=1549642 RepID=UPI0025AEDCEC|nr:DUF3103 family protein [Streptomyces sp. SRF1]MDN3060043.1 DUF3103 family protein [Streptomyces sp. SRF1]